MPELKKAPRPQSVDGATPKAMTGCGSIYVTIGEVDGDIFEVFAKLGKAGGCAAAQIEAIARLISLARRFGIKPDEIVKQLKGISCHEGDMTTAKSCADAIAIEIEKAALPQPELPEIETPGQDDKEPEAKAVAICVTDDPDPDIPGRHKCKKCKGLWFIKDKPPICKARP